MPKKKPIMNVLEKAKKIVKEETYNRVMAIYQIGSWLYQTASKDSDYDYIVVIDRHSEFDKMVDEKETKMSFHILSEVNISNSLLKHDAVLLPILFLPSEFVIYEKEEASERRKNWKIDFKRLEKGILREVQVCITKSERYFPNDKYLGLKNIIHAIRYLLFGIQLANTNKINDYTCANTYFKEIMDLKLNDWSEYYSHFQPILEKTREEFLKILHSKISVVSKEIFKPKDSLATLDFLKYRTLDDLKKYFSINTKFSEEKRLYILNGSPKRTDLINMECCPLVLDEKLNFVAQGIYFPHFDNTLQGDLDIYIIDGILIYFFYEKQWTYLNSKKDFIDKKPKVINDQNQILIYNNMKELIGEIDKNTFKPKHSFENLKKLEAKNYKQLQKYFYKNLKDQEYILVDKNGNYQKVQHPYKLLKKSMKKKKDTMEDSLLLMIKNFDLKSLITKREEEDNDDSYLELNKNIKTYKRFKQIFDDEYERVKDLEKTEFEEHCKDSLIGDALLAKKKGELDIFFINLSLDDFKEYLEYEPQRVKRVDPLIQEWKKLKLIEVLPKEIISLFLDFLDHETVLSMSISSKQFQWIPSNSFKAKELLKGIEFSRNFIERMSPYYKTEEYQALVRLSDLKKSDSISLFDHLYLLKPRDLNSYEKELFSQPKELVVNQYVSNYKEFLENMNQLYDYDNWEEAIDEWGVFYVSGLSLTNALLKTPKSYNELSIYYTGMDRKFYEYIGEFENLTGFVSKVDDYTGDHVKGHFLIDGKDKKVNVEFYRCSSTTFDKEFDVSEAYFNGSELICSRSFIEALNTKTFTITNHQSVNVQNLMRTKSLGFQLIHPKNLNINLLVEKEKEILTKKEKRSIKLEKIKEDEEEKGDEENDEKGDEGENEEDEDEEEDEEDEEENEVRMDLLESTEEILSKFESNFLKEKKRKREKDSPTQKKHKRIESDEEENEESSD